MFKLAITLLAVVSLLLASCGGHSDSANCVDRTRPEEPVVVDPSFCRDVNPGGGSGGGINGGEFLLYYLLFSHAFMPYGTVASPAVINHYHATTVVNKNTTYKTQGGGVIKTDKTGKATVKAAPKPSAPKPSAPKAAPPKSAPSRPAPAPAPKPSSPPPRSAPPSGGGRR